MAIISETQAVVAATPRPPSNQNRSARETQQTGQQHQSLAFFEAVFQSSIHAQ